MWVEVLSPGTEGTDRGDKFLEYEQGGVREYWLIDAVRKETIFYRRNEAGIYIRQELNAEGRYQTPLLPGFWLDTATLWLEEDDMPDTEAILAAVKQMIQS
jgi:Uma2 family endonuclease